MTAVERFTRAARAAFAAIPLGPAIAGTGAQEHPGLEHGCTDDQGYVKTCAAGDTRRWFMVDRVSQGLTVAQQITTDETPTPIYPVCQWEIEGEGERDDGVVPRTVVLTYQVVALHDRHEWRPPELVDAVAAAAMRWFTAAEIEAEDAHVGAMDDFNAGGYRTLTAAEIEAAILERIYKERQDLLSFRSGPVVGQEGQAMGTYEAVRTLSLWSEPA